MYASSADLTGVIGASRVSGHARKRAILVRIPSLGGRLGTGRGEEGAFRRSRPLFRPLVRGKLISFIRGGDEGREREREEKGGGNQFLLASAWFGEILFRARSAERLSLPRKYGGKGSKQKNGLVLSSISNPLPLPVEIAISPAGIRASYSPLPATATTQGSTFSISRCEYIRQDGDPSI